MLKEKLKFVFIQFLLGCGVAAILYVPLHFFFFVPWEQKIAAKKKHVEELKLQNDAEDLKLKKLEAELVQANTEAEESLRRAFRTDLENCAKIHQVVIEKINMPKSQNPDLKKVVVPFDLVLKGDKSRLLQFATVFNTKTSLYAEIIKNLKANSEKEVRITVVGNIQVSFENGTIVGEREFTT